MMKIIVSICIAALSLAAIGAVGPTDEQYVNECDRQMRQNLCSPFNDTSDPVFSSSAPPRVVYGIRNGVFFKQTIERPVWAILQVGGPNMCQTVVKQALATDPEGKLAFAIRALYTPKNAQ
jgi:hypothetical protein